MNDRKAMTRLNMLMVWTNCTQDNFPCTFIFFSGFHTKMYITLVLYLPTDGCIWRSWNPGVTSWQSCFLSVFASCSEFLWLHPAIPAHYPLVTFPPKMMEQHRIEMLFLQDINSVKQLCFVMPTKAMKSLMPVAGSVRLSPLDVTVVKITDVERGNGDPLWIFSTGQIYRSHSLSMFLITNGKWIKHFLKCLQSIFL